MALKLQPHLSGRNRVDRMTPARSSPNAKAINIFAVATLVCLFAPADDLRADPADLSENIPSASGHETRGLTARRTGSGLAGICAS